MKIQKFFYKNIDVSFDDKNFLDATSIAKHFDKFVKDYLKTVQTQDYINALAQNLSVGNIILTANDLVVVRQGGVIQGTWLHPKLAVNFARWLSADFAVWCDLKIDELINQQKPVALIPQSFSEALMLAAQLQAEKEQNAPKVEAFDRLATATEGAMNLTNAAKHLQMQPRAFNQFLFSHGWIYKRTIGSAWIAYQDKLQRGYLEHKAHPVTQSDGSEKIYPQVLVTAKGLAKLSTMLNKAAA